MKAIILLCLILGQSITSFALIRKNQSFLQVSQDLQVEVVGAPDYQPNIPYTKEEFKALALELYNSLDSDNSGKLDFPEFAQAYYVYHQEMYDEQILCELVVNTYLGIDEMNLGYISKGQFTRWLTKLIDLSFNPPNDPSLEYGAYIIVEETTTTTTTTTVTQEATIAEEVKEVKKAAPKPKPAAKKKEQDFGIDDYDTSPSLLIQKRMKKLSQLMNNNPTHDFPQFLKLSVRHYEQYSTIPQYQNALNFGNQIFDLVDANQVGYLTLWDFANCYAEASFVVNGTKVSIEEIITTFQAFDKDKNDYIERTEFLNWFIKLVALAQNPINMETTQPNLALFIQNAAQCKSGQGSPETNCDALFGLSHHGFQTNYTQPEGDSQTTTQINQKTEKTVYSQYEIRGFFDSNKVFQDRFLTISTFREGELGYFNADGFYVDVYIVFYYDVNGVYQQYISQGYFNEQGFYVEQTQGGYYDLEGSYYSVENKSESQQQQVDSFTLEEDPTTTTTTTEEQTTVQDAYTQSIEQKLEYSQKIVNGSELNGFYDLEGVWFDRVMLISTYDQSGALSFVNSDGYTVDVYLIVFYIDEVKTYKICQGYFLDDGSFVQLAIGGYYSSDQQFTEQNYVLPQLEADVIQRTTTAEVTVSIQQEATTVQQNIIEQATTVKEVQNEEFVEAHQDRLVEEQKIQAFFDSNGELVGGTWYLTSYQDGALGYVNSNGYYVDVYKIYWYSEDGTYNEDLTQGFFQEDGFFVEIVNGGFYDFTGNFVTEVKDESGLVVGAQKQATGFVDVTGTFVEEEVKITVYTVTTSEVQQFETNSTEYVENTTTVTISNETSSPLSSEKEIEQEFTDTIVNEQESTEVVTEEQATVVTEQQTTVETEQQTQEGEVATIVTGQETTIVTGEETTIITGEESVVNEQQQENAATTNEETTTQETLIEQETSYHFDEEGHVISTYIIETSNDVHLTEGYFEEDGTFVEVESTNQVIVEAQSSQALIEQIISEVKVVDPAQIEETRQEEFTVISQEQIQEQTIIIEDQQIREEKFEEVKHVADAHCDYVADINNVTVQVIQQVKEESSLVVEEISQPQEVVYVSETFVEEHKDQHVEEYAIQGFFDTEGNFYQGSFQITTYQNGQQGFINSNGYYVDVYIQSWTDTEGVTVQDLSQGYFTTEGYYVEVAYGGYYDHTGTFVDTVKNAEDGTVLGIQFEISSFVDYEGNVDDSEVTIITYNAGSEGYYNDDGKYVETFIVPCEDESGQASETLTQGYFEDDGTYVEINYGGYETSTKEYVEYITQEITTTVVTNTTVIEESRSSVVTYYEESVINTIVEEQTGQVVTTTVTEESNTVTVEQPTTTVTEEEQSTTTVTQEEQPTTTVTEEEQPTTTVTEEEQPTTTVTEESTTTTVTEESTTTTVTEEQSSSTTEETQSQTIVGKEEEVKFEEVVINDETVIETIQPTIQVTYYVDQTGEVTESSQSFVLTTYANDVHSFEDITTGQTVSVYVVEYTTEDGNNVQEVTQGYFDQAEQYHEIAYGGYFTEQGEFVQVFKDSEGNVQGEQTTASQISTSETTVVNSEIDVVQYNEISNNQDYQVTFTTYEAGVYGYFKEDETYVDVYIVQLYGPDNFYEESLSQGYFETNGNYVALTLGGYYDLSGTWIEVSTITSTEQSTVETIEQREERVENDVKQTVIYGYGEYKFTSQEIRALAKQVFESIDSNGDGALDLFEFNEAYQWYIYMSYGYFLRNEQVVTAFQLLDVDESEEISECEFASWFKLMLQVCLAPPSDIETLEVTNPEMAFVQEYIQRKKIIAQVAI